MTTWTIGQIVDRCIAVVEAITPDVAEPQGRGFVLNRAPSRPLRLWTQDAGANGRMRTFDIELGQRSDVGPNPLQAVQVDWDILILVAYPGDPKLYSLTHRHELDALIASDARQIRDALVRPAGLAGSGHVANFITTIPGPDRASERVLFQAIPMTARFYHPQRS